MMVTLHPFTHYAASHPTPSDVRLLIEVSDSTLRMDRGKKANVYARAGIADYWIVDLNHRCVIVHRQPTGEGYQEVVAYNESEEVALLACPEVPIAVSQLLPPAN